MNTKWIKPFASNDYRRTLTLAHAGWWSTAGIVVLRAFGAIPQNFGSLAILTLGVAVAASLALSRMRLAETITEVFRVGMNVASNLSKPSTRPTAAATVLLDHLRSCESCLQGEHCDARAAMIGAALEERHGTVNTPR